MTIEEMAQQAGVKPIAQQSVSVTNQPKKGLSIEELAAQAGVKPIEPIEQPEKKGNIIWEGIKDIGRTFAKPAGEVVAGSYELAGKKAPEWTENKRLSSPIMRAWEATGYKTDLTKIDKQDMLKMADKLKEEGAEGATFTDVVNALSFLPGGAFAKGGKVASSVASGGLKTAVKEGAKVGAGYGAAYGVAGNLDSEDPSLGGAIKEGALGTVMGAGLGAVTPVALSPVIKAGEKVASKFIPKVKQNMLRKQAVVASEKAVKETKKIEKALFDIENNYAKTRKANSFAEDGNAAARKRIAQSDVMVGAVDKEGTILTKTKGGAIDKYKAQTIDGSEQVVRNLLEREGATVETGTLVAKLTEKIMDSGLEGKALQRALRNIDGEVEGILIRATPEGKIPLTAVHDAKIAVTKGIDYNTEAFVKAERKAIARAYKEMVEEVSQENIKPINEELSKYLNDIKILENLDGKKVKGGRLRKYFAGITGNIVGGTLGGTVGGLPGMAIGTVAGGEVSSKISGKMLERTFGKGTGLKPQASKLLEEAVSKTKLPKAKPLMLPAAKPGSPRKSFGTGPTIKLPARTEKVLGDQVVAKKGLPKKSTSTKLLSEAKKYKSAEEFVKAQGESVYHGTSADFDVFSDTKLGSNTGAKSSKIGHFFTDSLENANVYSESVLDGVDFAIQRKILSNNELEFKSRFINTHLGLPPKVSVLSTKGKPLTKNNIIDIILKKFDDDIVELKKQIRTATTDNEPIIRLDEISSKKSIVKDLWLKELNKIKIPKPKIKEVYLDYNNPFIVKQQSGKFREFKTQDGKTIIGFSDVLEKAKASGHDAVIMKGTKDPLIANNTIVFSDSQIKTKSQLTDIWKQANAVKSNSLVKEAKKYKSAEEFVDSNIISKGEKKITIGGEEYTGKVYYENGKEIGTALVDGDEIVAIKSNVTGGGSKIIEKLFIKKDSYYIRATPEARGFWEKVGASKLSLNENSGLYEGYLKKENLTKSQLTDIWKKANK